MTQSNTKAILTIDFDYFVDATMEFRELYFPDCPNEALSLEIQNFIWTTRYNDPKLLKVSIKQAEFHLVKNLLQTIYQTFLKQGIDPKERITFSRSHEDVYSIAEKYLNAGDSIKLDVYNVDFHHDMFCMTNVGIPVNCGNWAYVLYDKYHENEQKLFEYHWVKQADSEIHIIGNAKVSDVYGVCFEDLDDIITLGNQGYFDEIHLCRSDFWTPPHLDSYFHELSEGIECTDKDNILTDKRWKYIQPLIEEEEIPTREVL